MFDESDGRKLVNPDADFRRAFPLDSRSVWIEQQNIHGVLLPKDNFPLGPGEYSPIKIPRHISTPSLGFRDHFKTFNPNGNSRQNVQSGASNRVKTSSTVRQDFEYKTIFHDHSERNPLDPKNMRTATSGPMLVHSDPTVSVLNDGVHSVKSLPFGPNYVPFGERCPTKLAFNDYDVKDSLCQRKIKLGCKVDESRFKYTTNKKMEKIIPRTNLDVRPWRHCETSDVYLNHQKFLDECDELSLATMEKGRTKLTHGQPVVRMDSSVYHNIRGPVVNICRYNKLPSIDPASINKQIKSNAFGRILTLPRAHTRTYVNSKIADTLEKYC